MIVFYEYIKAEMYNWHFSDIVTANPILTWLQNDDHFMQLIGITFQ